MGDLVLVSGTVTRICETGAVPLCGGELRPQSEHVDASLCSVSLAF